jgi:hypothetical protein
MSGLGRKEFSAGDILLASEVQGYLQDQAVMVFADSTARGSAIPSPSEGMLTYNLDTASLELYDGSSFIGVGKSMSKRIEAFTASGTWTVPTGVTYAIAHMIGGGGGIGSASSGSGGASSVAFSGGTVSATGGNGVDIANLSANAQATAAQANSGQGGRYFGRGDGVVLTQNLAAGQLAFDGNQIVAADTVTPAASITVTVGAGGVAGTNGAAGGSGYVFIEYYE